MAHEGALPNPTQSQQILAWLKAGNTLTPTQALNMFGCFRLGARIYDLKQEGHRIRTEIVRVKTRGGAVARVAEYSMPSTQVAATALPGQIDMDERWERAQ